MPNFLERLDERGIPYRLREQHTGAMPMCAVGPPIRAGACGRLTSTAVVCLARVRRLRAAIAPNSAPTRLAKYRAVTLTSHAERKTP